MINNWKLSNVFVLYYKLPKKLKTIQRLNVIQLNVSIYQYKVDNIILLKIALCMLAKKKMYTETIEYPKISLLFKKNTNFAYQ